VFLGKEIVGKGG